MPISKLRQCATQPNDVTLWYFIRIMPMRFASALFCMLFFQGIITDYYIQNVIFVAGNEYKTAFHCTVQHKVKYNERNMKLRDKDTKKYLLTVFVATFVAYIIPAVVLYLGYFMGIMLTICISLFNLSMALLAWLWAKSVRKEFLLKRQIILNSLVTLLLIGIISLVVTNGAALSLSLIVFVWLGIFNLLPICIQYVIYSFISKRTNSKKERPI